jgi:hypothetical protein
MDFSINCSEATGYSLKRKKNLDLYLTEYTKIHSRWTKTLNIEKNLCAKLVEDNRIFTALA